MTTQQPEALRLAEMLTANEWPGHVTLVSYARECVAELRRQHARITELESQLAQRFDAADMATAAAQGFRAGAASVDVAQERPTPEHIEAMQRAWLWMENQAEAQSKGGHATFDLMMLRDERDALRAALAAGQPVAQQGVAYAELPDEREAFESWLRSVWTAGYGCPKCDSGKYVHGEAQRFWECWQARASHGQAPASVLHLVHSAFAEIAMAFPKAFALHKVGIADTAVREALAAPVPPPECETEAEKRAFAFGWFKALESERMKAESVPKAQFDDPKVQAVYAILCDDADWPPKENPQQHWEGWIARRIVDALLADSVQEDAARYRWLCCKFGETRFPCALENWLEHGYIADGKPSIDAAIDAAIKQGKKQ